MMMISRTLREICRVDSVKPRGLRLLQGSVGEWQCEEVLRWRGGDHQLGLRASLHPDKLYFYVFRARLLDKE